MSGRYNWLDRPLNASYKDVFNELLRIEKEQNADQDDDSLTASVFNSVMQLYKTFEEKFPYDMNEINYLTGDATEPVGNGKKIICHICNDIGGWRRGFVVALSKKCPFPEKMYREWYRLSKNGNSPYDACFPEFHLGNVIFTTFTNPDIRVANMIAQHDIITNTNGVPPIRYEALEHCLEKVAEEALKTNASIHMPRIGAGLAGGDWNIIENIIIKTLVEKGIPTFVYSLMEDNK